MQNKKTLIVSSGFVALMLTAAVGIANTRTRSVYVPSGSMLPNLTVGSTVPVKLNAYQKISDVQRGDIIVHTRTDRGRRVDSLKRVVGLPGDVIVAIGTTLKINGRALPHKLVRKVGKVSVYTETNGAASYAVQYGDNTAPAPAFRGVVPAGQLFCLGDNRDNAYDSRYLGGVFFGEVIGKKVP